MEKIKVVLADDHDILRRSLAAALRRDRDFEVLGEAVNGRELVSLCRKRLPDVAVVDIRMPVLDGIEAAKILKAELPRVKILILTTFDDDEYLCELFSLGIDGYLLKGEEGVALSSAVKSVYIGINTLDRAIVAKMSAAMAGDSARRLNLSDMEIKIAKLIAQGFYNKDIARELNISYGYVRNLVSEVYRKLGVVDRVDMAGKLETLKQPEMESRK